MKKVLIIYRFLPHYRVEFYNNLKNILNNHGIILDLVYGKYSTVESARKDEAVIEWAKYVPNKTFQITKNIELFWQPIISKINNYDLVIVEQANKLLLNYLLLINRAIFNKRFAFWGHGLNLQISPSRLSNKIKRILTRKTDWWFAYTDGTKNIVKNAGFPEEKICVVQNAIDTKTLHASYKAISDDEVAILKSQLGLGNGKTGIYCGSFYKGKGIDFLIRACDEIKSSIKDFQMIIIGSGPDENIVNKAVESRDWIHFVGPKLYAARIPYFKLADVLLIPDAVGLVILDSFAFETPLITTKGSYHGPEIEYLRPNENGIITEKSVNLFSKTVVSLLKEPVKYNLLKNGCIQSVGKYTLENMVDNYSKGIINCLKYYENKNT